MSTNCWARRSSAEYRKKELWDLPKNTSEWHTLLEVLGIWIIFTTLSLSTRMEVSQKRHHKNHGVGVKPFTKRTTCKESDLIDLMNICWVTCYDKQKIIYTRNLFLRDDQSHLYAQAGQYSTMKQRWIGRQQRDSTSSSLWKNIH